jgi:RNA polymerase sigma-70 factor (ECF subfamily)
VLLQVRPSPVVAMNRAVAVAHAVGPHEGLADLDALASDLERYQPFHAARAELLRRAGRRAEALESARRALEAATNPAERHLMEQRVADLRTDPR